jgi:23S rRNA-/tRNA-specific pseudouridylate synthase
VLFTKSKRVNAAIAQTFSDHTTVKVYQALTIPRADAPREWTIKNQLGTVSSRSKRSIYGAVRSGGQFAETSFRVLAKYPLGLWVEAIPRTGRTHQIRVHLSEFGLPIIGDDLYGTPEVWGKLAPVAPRLMLHAARLIVRHPVTGRELSVRSPLPEDFERCRRDSRDLLPPGEGGPKGRMRDYS